MSAAAKSGSKAVKEKSRNKLNQAAVKTLTDQENVDRDGDLIIDIQKSDS